MMDETTIVEPNYFVFKTNVIEITYSTSSMAGHPELSLKCVELDFQSDPKQKGEDITDENTALGKVVTVILGGEPDRWYDKFHLLIPTVQLTEKNKMQEIKNAQAIFSRHATSIAGYPIGGGQVIIYREFLTLNGKAEKVYF